MCCARRSSAQLPKHRRRAAGTLYHLLPAGARSRCPVCNQTRGRRRRSLGRRHPTPSLKRPLTPGGNRMTKMLVFTEFGGPETQEFVDQDFPAPKGAQVAIQVKAAGVNPADWKIRTGQMGDHWQLPAPMGREAAGIVTAIGEKVEDFAVGDEVLGLAATGHGTFAEHTVLNANQIVAKPEELSFADAAALPVAGGTAYDVTHQIELEPGPTMVILGAGGGVGLMAAQIGKVHQFNVIGVASASKQQLIEAIGATFVESGDGAADRVREIAPEGADVLIDLVGGDALREIAPVAK